MLVPSTCTAPPLGQSQPQNHNGFGMTLISMSAPNNAVPMTTGYLSSVSSSFYKNASFSLPPSLRTPPPSITTTVPPNFFSVQTGDVNTSCSFDDDCKEGETIRTIKEPAPKEKIPTQECQICKVNLCDDHKDLFHAK